MAVKKTATKSGGVKAAPKKAAAKKAAPKKAEATPEKVAAKAPKAEKAEKTKPAAKAAAPKAKAATTAKAAPKKKAATVKLTDGQIGLLKKVSETTEGYVGTKAEARSLESLATKKMVKRGAKDKATGMYRYSVSKTGEKYLASLAAASGA